MTDLFGPVRIGSLNLRNRLVMAPMTRRMSPGGVMGADVTDYYVRRAEGGVGMIISEGLATDHPASIHNSAVPTVHGLEQLAALGRTARAVQAKGAAFVAQLWHTGGARTKFEGVVNPDVASVSASGVYYPGKPYGAPMSLADIDAVVASYGRGAAAAQAAGCDGVNIHGAHGYLIDSFLWSETNLRDDAYGFADRTRFACEVVAECRRQTSPDFPIMLRLSQFKEQAYEARLCDTPEELALMLAPLVDAGVDIFDCSTRRFWQAAFAGSDRTFAGWVRHLSDVATMTVGSVGLADDVISAMHRGESSRADRLDRLREMLARGEFDLVGVGRALISDPDWTFKVATGREGELRGFDVADLQHLT
jgi:2,4-dienoyl-CoA reductase-like NADH-dependent reductase (Old Yellow Enzyme family)